LLKPTPPPPPLSRPPPARQQVIGEFGSYFEQPEDVTWLSDFATWVNQQSNAVGAPLGWAFWAYNANSGDTGGIAAPNWQTFMWVKLRFLQARLGLRPWYA
jgi:endoglucanase